MALIVFDIDGTLLQTDLITVPAVQRTFAAFGLPEPDAAKICSFFGRPNEEYLDWMAALCPPGRAAEIVEAVNKLELGLVGSEGRLYPGVREMIDGLKHEGHMLAICSNGPEDYVGAFLDAHKMRGFFSQVVTRGDRYDDKTAMLREIMMAVRVRPVVVVGDRDDDVSAAHANGATAIGTLYGFGAREELARADCCVQSVMEIEPAIHALLE